MQTNQPNMKTVELLPNDRVAVFNGESIVKGRVKEVMANGRVMVTMSKDDTGSIFLREQIYPLYRKVGGLPVPHDYLYNSDGTANFTKTNPLDEAI